MDFPTVNAIPHPSAQSGVLPQTPPVKPVEAVGRLTNDDAGIVRQPPEPITTLPGTRSGDLAFSVDEGTERLVVSIYDDKGEVVRQIPSEVVLKMANQIHELLDTAKVDPSAVKPGGAA